MDTRIDVLLKPIWFDRIPTAQIGIDGDFKEVLITEPTWFSFSVNKPRGSKITLSVNHYGKTDKDTDTVNNRDTAIVIEEIKLNDINCMNFIWQGLYRPDYPHHYPNKVPGIGKGKNAYEKRRKTCPKALLLH